jgi:hypothetical protein
MNSQHIYHLTSANLVPFQGLPLGAVKNALQRDGLDAAIMDLDPEKSLASQQKQEEEELVDKGPPLKDDPKYQKYFKVSRRLRFYPTMSVFFSNTTCMTCCSQMLKMVSLVYALLLFWACSEYLTCSLYFARAFQWVQSKMQCSATAWIRR